MHGLSYKSVFGGHCVAEMGLNEVFFSAITDVDERGRLGDRDSTQGRRSLGLCCCMRLGWQWYQNDDCTQLLIVVTNNKQRSALSLARGKYDLFERCTL